MTEKEIEQNKSRPITIKRALAEAFEAGWEHRNEEEKVVCVGQATRWKVVEALMERINLE